MDQVAGLEEAEIKDVLKTVYENTRQTLANWLAANTECRDGREEAAIAKKAQEAASAS